MSDFNDGEAIAEAVQRPTMKFVAIQTADLQALHRVRERLVGQRTGIINQIRAYLLERSIAVRQGVRFLRTELPGILATRTDDELSPRMSRVIEELAGDWRHLDAHRRSHQRDRNARPSGSALRAADDGAAHWPRSSRAQ
jgi:transposase